MKITTTVLDSLGYNDYARLLAEWIDAGIMGFGFFCVEDYA